MLIFASGCSGFTPSEAPHHYARVAEGFKAEGVVVVFVDYLGTRGLVRCGDAIHPDEVAADILAATEYVRARPFARRSEISVIGWSIGASGVLGGPGDAAGRPAVAFPKERP